MNKHERRVLQTFLKAYDIPDVRAYLKWLNYLYSLADEELKKTVEYWTNRFTSESGYDPTWWDQQLTPYEYSNLQSLMNQEYHYVMTGQVPQALELFSMTQLTRYEALERQVAIERLKYTAKETQMLSEVLPKVYKNQYQQHLFNIGKEIGYFKVDFNRFDSREFEILAAKSFADGRSFKDIVFDHNQNYLPKRVRKLTEDKVKTLAKGLATGASPLQMGKELSEINDISLREAVTLMGDELGLINNESNLQSYEELDIEEYIYLATLENHTCGICRDLDHKTFKVSEAVVGLNFPLIHSHCRCTTKAKTLFSNLSDVRWSSQGYVKGNLSFNQWLEQVYYRG